jgi:hypothetical protein
VVDISAARAIGYAPTHDLESGMATVWPDFRPAGPGESDRSDGSDGSER